MDNLQQRKEIHNHVKYLVNNKHAKISFAITAVASIRHLATSYVSECYREVQIEQKLVKEPVKALQTKPNNLTFINNYDLF